MNTINSVTFTMEVIDGSGRAVQKLPPKRNLLLDQGMNYFATKYAVVAFSYFVLGTGTTPTSRDSGTITATIAGGVATASAGFFQTQDVGRLLKLDTGAEMYITEVTSTTQAKVTGANAAASQFTIWYVNLVGLDAEQQRFNTVVRESGANGWSWNNTTGVLSTWVTRVGRFETGPIVYNEVGWSPYSSTENNLTGRAVLSGGVSLAAGQALKIKVQLDRVVNPTTPRAITASVAGWASLSGYEQIENLELCRWNSNGEQDGGYYLEPSGTYYLSPFLATSSEALMAMTDGTVEERSISGSVGQADDVHLEAYVLGSFTRRLVCGFGLNRGNSDSIRSFALGGGSSRSCYRVLFDSPQVKTSAQTLTLYVDRSWSRTLVN